MRENFDRAAAFVLKQEVDPGHEDDGSLHIDPADPGGATRFGISQRAYPDVDLTKLDKAGALKIYLDRWIAAGCDNLPWPLDLIHFDSDFNMTHSAAKKLLQISKGDPIKYMFHRMLVYYFMWKLKGYFRGWVKRVLDLWQVIYE